jgi:hypothetical protein
MNFLHEKEDYPHPPIITSRKVLSQKKSNVVSSSKSKKQESEPNSKRPKKKTYEHTRQCQQNEWACKFPDRKNLDMYYYLTLYTSFKFLSFLQPLSSSSQQPWPISRTFSSIVDFGLLCNLRLFK